MSDERKLTAKHEEARSSLPAELQPIFDEFVADYKFHAMTRHGAPYVSYIVLADMVRSGWRRMDESKAPRATTQASGDD